MLMDKQTELSDAQAVTATGDTASENVIDTENALDVGIGEHAYLVSQIQTTLTSGGAATVQVILETATDEAFTSPVEAAAGPVKTIGTDTVDAGTTMFKAKLPTGLLRYIRVAYRVGTAVLTAGKFDTFVTKDVDAQQFGDSGFSVS